MTILSQVALEELQPSFYPMCVLLKGVVCENEDEKDCLDSPNTSTRTGLNGLGWDICETLPLGRGS